MTNFANSDSARLQMRTPIRVLILSMVVLAITLTSNAVTAEVISDTNITFTTVNFPDAKYRAIVKQAANGDDTGIFFNTLGATISATGATLDEGSDWYLVNAGDIFSADSIASNQFTVIFQVTSQPPFFLSNTVSIPLGN